MLQIRLWIQINQIQINRIQINLDPNKAVEV